MDVFATNFAALDWAIVGAYTLGSIVIGVYANRYVSRLSHYMVAGRGLGVYLGIATLAGTEIGLVTLMYNAQEGFIHGFSAFHIGVVSAIGFLLIGLTGFIIYRMREMEVMTIPELYERRFGRGVRLLGGIILTFSGILNMGLFLQAGSRFVAALTGIGSGVGVRLIMTVMLVVVLIYTTLGGMVSVVITDYFQFLVLGSGIVLTTCYAVSHVGWSRLFRIVMEEKGAAAFNPIQDPAYGWMFVLWMAFVAVAAGSLWLPSNVRALSAKSPKVAKRVYTWTSIAFLARTVLPMAWGIAAFVFVTGSPELKAFIAQRPEHSQMAMPLFLAKIIPSGFLGIIAAGMLAAFMSTHDSYLLCWSTVLTQDIVGPLSPRPLSASKRITLTRVFVVLIGIYLLIWGLWYEARTSLWTYMAITGTIYLAGAFSVVVGALYWKRASTVGAYAALATGTVAGLGLVPWMKLLDAPWAKHLNERNFGFGAVILAALAMVAGSLLCPDKPRTEG